jgi:hypothetical protein
VKRVETTPPYAVTHAVDVPDGQPYAFSDQTGQATLQALATGTWTVIHDGVGWDAEWNEFLWNTEENCDPGIEGLTVEARAADAPTELVFEPFTPVYQGERVPYDPVTYRGDLRGRFLEIRVRFKGTCTGGAFATPQLCNLRVGHGLGDLNCDGMLDPSDVDPFLMAVNKPNDYAVAFPDCDILFADVNSDGTVDDFDIDPFFDLMVAGYCD